MRIQSIRVVALLGCVLLAAGCLGSPGTGSPSATGTDTQTPTPDLSPSPTTDSSPSPTDETRTATLDPHSRAENEPNRNHSVVIWNGWNRSVEMTVTVVRDATNETVYEGTDDLAAGAEKTVYDTAEADPDGIESFTVTVTARNSTERVTVRTNNCYGDAYGEIQDDGALYVYYEIC